MASVAGEEPELSEYPKTGAEEAVEAVQGRYKGQSAEEVKVNGPGTANEAVSSLREINLGWGNCL